LKVVEVVVVVVVVVEVVVVVVLVVVVVVDVVVVVVVVVDVVVVVVVVEVVVVVVVAVVFDQLFFLFSLTWYLLLGVISILFNGRLLDLFFSNFVLNNYFSSTDNHFLPICIPLQHDIIRIPFLIGYVEFMSYIKQNVIIRCSLIILLDFSTLTLFQGYFFIRIISFESITLFDKITETHSAVNFGSLFVDCWHCYLFGVLQILYVILGVIQKDCSIFTLCGRLL
jgi:hypothetical protein